MSQAATSGNVTFDFSGQTVIVTGAGRGIGLAISECFAAAKADVVMVDMDRDVAEQEAARLGATAVVANIANTAEVESVVSSTIERAGRIDVLINNAGILRDGVLWKTDDDAWESVLAVHLGGSFRLIRACVPHFRERQYGRVINFTSYTGLHGNPGQSNYAAAKAGLIGLTKTAAKELGRFGITVNAISPNANTRMIASIPEDRRAEMTAHIPAGRIAEPNEISAAVAFLASAEASYITGVVLPVDGGVAM
jgi:3-oxoacyl-[acyl-carrier protein] reductase